MELLIPVVSSISYLLGGQVNKWFRWGMGLWIGLLAWHGIIPLLLCTIAYLIATNAFSYGEKMWTTKLFGKWVSMGIAGIALGAASFILLPISLAIIQTIVALVSFLALKYLDDKDILKNPWQELLRGALGTILYIPLAFL